MLTKFRIRGYQFKSEGNGEPRKNPAPYRSLDDAREKLEEAGSPSPNLDAQDLEEHGFEEKAPGVVSEHESPD